MEIPKPQGESRSPATPLPTELSHAARSALSLFVQESRGYVEPGIIPQAERTIRTLAYFAPGQLSRLALDATALQSVADAIRRPNQPIRQAAAGGALLSYFQSDKDNGSAQNPVHSARQAGRNSKSNAYVGTIFGDMPYIDNTADRYKERLSDDTLARLDGNEAITRDDWMNLRVGASVPEIAKISRSTNVETQLARAALRIDQIAYPRDDDQEQLHNILSVDTLFAPFSEVYGLHALDMMAQSLANKTRVLKSGNEKVLDFATEMLDQAKQVSTDEIMRNYFGRYPQEYQFSAPQESLYGETIVYKSASLDDLTDGRHVGDVGVRFKTVGKSAVKMLRNPSYSLEAGVLPADIAGMLAILPDEQQLGKFFTHTIEQAMANSSIDLVNSGSKKAPIFIQGSPEYVQKVCEQIPNEILNRYVQINEITDRPASHVYQVAKFTSVLSTGGQKLPVEVQFLTSADRENSRFGVPSHMNHNAGKGPRGIIPGSPDDLYTIHIRKHNVDPYGERVNRLSIPHGVEFNRQFRAVIDAKR